MEERTQAVVDALINAMENREKIIRKELSKKIKEYHLDDHRFMPGWAQEISLRWQRWPRSTEIEGYYDVRIFLYSDRFKEKTDVDITFLTEKIFDKDIVPALSEWLQKKVDCEKWGGLFDAKFVISLDMTFQCDPLSTDPPHMQEWICLEAKIRVENEERLERRRQFVHDFIANKEYETEDIGKICWPAISIYSIVSIAAEDFYDEFGPETLRAFYDRLMERTLEADKKDEETHCISLSEGLARAARVLVKPKDGRKPTEEMFSLACHLCMSVMIHADEYRKEDGREALKVVASCGSKEAKNILKFGTGRIPPEIMTYKDDLVTCTANDVEKTINLKLKEESEGAYRAMIEYILRLINAGFPRNYTIKFNSKEKTYIHGIEKTKAQVFWNNCARYPALWPLMKEYVRTVHDPLEYYSDAEGVPLGGYAMFALGLADASNSDIVEEFMRENDEEHSDAPNYFVLAYVEKFGIHAGNAKTVVTCAFGANNGISRLIMPGEQEAASAVAAVLLEIDSDEYLYAMDVLFGGREGLIESIKKAEGEAKTILEKLLRHVKW